MPEAPNINARCQDEGILGTVTGVVGTLIANEIIKVITNIESTLLDHILIINFESLSFRKAKIVKMSKCRNND